jgi:hypothetical protein
MVAGCEKEGATAPSPSAAPATSPATAPAVPPLRLRIDEEVFVFTPAVLVVSGTAPHVTARLYNSDEGGDQEGNAILLDCPLELEADAPLAEAAHHLRTSNRERTEALSGIFLPAEKVKLQPMELSLSFASGPDEPRPPIITVKLSGRFLVFPEDADVPTQSVAVQGEFSAMVRYEQTPVDVVR